MMRTIIAVSGSSNAGKTTTIRLAYEQLSEKSDILDGGRRARKEVRGAVLEIEGVKVGFASPGDREDVLRENLDRLIEAGCQVIVCATHTSRSATYRVVYRLKSGYRIVWIEKDRTEPADESRANQETADEIIQQVTAAVEEARLVGA